MLCIGKLFCVMFPFLIVDAFLILRDRKATVFLRFAVFRTRIDQSQTDDEVYSWCEYLDAASFKVID